MVTQIEIREVPPTAKVLKSNKSPTGLTVAQKKLLKRKYKEAEALRGSVSSAWGRQAISALKNRSTLPLNVPNAREGVRRQAGIERKRQSDVEGGKLTSAKARAAWHEPFLQPQAILIATAFLACFAMVAGVRPGSRAVTAEMSDPPPIMAALRVEALEAEFASKVEAAPADTGKAGTIFTAGSQADGLRRSRSQPCPTSGREQMLLNSRPGAKLIGLCRKSKPSLSHIWQAPISLGQHPAPQALRLHRRPMRR